MTDTEIFVRFGTQFDSLSRRRTSLLNAARQQSGALANQVLDDIEQARRNKANARNKLFMKNEATIGNLITAFAQADNDMQNALQSLQITSITINQITGLITSATSAGKNLADKGE